MWNIEVTDVFCGQANYCWVLRGTTKAKTRRGRIEAAKQLAGWTGWVRVQVQDYGDMLEIRPTPWIWRVPGRVRHIHRGLTCPHTFPP